MIEEPQIIEVPAQRAAAIHLTIPAMEMGKYMDPAIKEILHVLSDQGHLPAGPLFSYHLRRPSDTFDFEIAFPVIAPFDPKGRVRMIERPAARIVRTVYTGSYDGLSGGWQALEKWVREQKLNESGRFWESYLTNPDQEPDPRKWRTELNWIV